MELAQLVELLTPEEMLELVGLALSDQGQFEVLEVIRVDDRKQVTVKFTKTGKRKVYELGEK